MTISFEDFLKLAPDHSITIGSDPPSFGHSGYYDTKPKTEDTPYLIAIWSTGGMSGGNCWNEGGHYATEGEPPAELTSLDDLLERATNHEIGFQQYKTMCSAVVHHDSYSQSEYYGNYSNYAVKYVNLKELYNYMVDKGWLTV